jgi:hypothetical protein
MSSSGIERAQVASTASPGNAAAPVRVLLALSPFVGVISFAIAEIVWLASGDDTDWRRILVMNAVTYLIGAQAFAAGVGHMFYGPPIARSIGWQPSPFQWEVGGANLGIGIAGVMAGSFGTEYWLAVIVMGLTFLWVAGIGHIRQIVKERNLAINNAGPILFLDFLAPAFCLVVWLLWIG